MLILLKLLSLGLDNGDNPGDFVNQFRLLQVRLRKLSPDLADHDVLLRTILFNNVRSDEMDKVRDKLQTDSSFDLTKTLDYIITVDRNLTLRDGASSTRAAPRAQQADARKKNPDLRFSTGGPPQGTHNIPYDLDKIVPKAGMKILADWRKEASSLKTSGAELAKSFHWSVCSDDVPFAWTCGSPLPGGYHYFQMFRFDKSNLDVVVNMRRRTEVERACKITFRDYGYPNRLHSDNAPEFKTKKMENLCNPKHVKQTFTEPHHPHQNPSERRGGRHKNT